jgi:small nuclear ribonucleoprotein (snRNP)-like protein
MKVLNNTNEHSATFMRDVFETLIGERVVVFTKGTAQLGGKLAAYNGYIIQLTDDNGIRNTYLSVDNVVAISSDK